MCYQNRNKEIEELLNSARSETFITKCKNYKYNIIFRQLFFYSNASKRLEWNPGSIILPSL